MNIQESVTLVKTDFLEAYVIPYETKFIEQCNSGWGCGYIRIEQYGPFYRKMILDKKLNGDNFGYYPSIYDFQEEITLCEHDGDSFIIGWDSAHRYQTLDNYPEAVIRAKTMELFNIIDNYTNADFEAYKAAKLRKFQDFLNSI